MANEVSEDETIHIKEHEAALVLRVDGHELYIPKMENPDENVPDHVLLLVAIAMRLKDDVFVKNMIEWFVGKAEEVLDKDEVNKIH